MALHIETYQAGALVSSGANAPKDIVLPATADNLTTLTANAQQALAVNAAFLALAAPTNAQVLAQTQRLTRECTAVIRLLLGLLDDTSGT